MSGVLKSVRVDSETRQMVLAKTIKHTSFGIPSALLPLPPQRPLRLRRGYKVLEPLVHGRERLLLHSLHSRIDVPVRCREIGAMETVAEPDGLVWRRLEVGAVR